MGKKWNTFANNVQNELVNSYIIFINQYSYKCNDLVLYPIHLNINICNLIEVHLFTILHRKQRTLKRILNLLIHEIKSNTNLAVVKNNYTSLYIFQNAIWTGSHHIKQFSTPKQALHKSQNKDLSKRGHYTPAITYKMLENGNMDTSTKLFASTCKHLTFLFKKRLWSLFFNCKMVCCVCDIVTPGHFQFQVCRTCLNFR